MKKGFLIGSLLIPAVLFAQKKPTVKELDKWKTQASSVIQERYYQYKDIAFKIWDYAELGYKEVKSSALLQETLKDNGFSVEAGVAGIPTAFVASYGSGSPVLGILAEFDALPGLSQQAVAEKNPIAGQANGHGCGHHLFGTASVAAAIAVKEQLQAQGWKGTIKVYGTPAEEGGSGKVYMVRAGLFDGVDAVLHWHPADENTTWADGALANKSAKFRFYGTAAHAAAAPDKGRSALDAVEAMNHMVNMMREHIPSDAKIHYVITQGGKAPNVVPDFAEVYYYVRHPNREIVMQLFERIQKAAEGAAIGTETRTDFEIIGGTYDLLLNNQLADIMQVNLVKVGGVIYTSSEKEFANKIQGGLGFKADPIETAGTVNPIRINTGKTTGSTDVGDVSYAVPTVGLRAATWVPGTPAHSWQAVACGGTEIGIKGMMVAAKTMAMTLLDLLHQPEQLSKAKAEFHAARGPGFRYIPLLGDRSPALNYRN
ncbi:M20 family metallopeptidase [Flavihumibacter cheonanensis]|uniref:amidohydrolase n=1 Tax=Flavihumibacter cheonanensis TaxID=1442385 RepID=UPI001EF7E031|nr:amidohydrolase [Flavihumibacter cheonanensis]MCG7753373.1 amidohydrolase [Flavihumibacter cheonanensis]